MFNVIYYASVVDLGTIDSLATHYNIQQVPFGMAVYSIYADSVNSNGPPTFYITTNTQSSTATFQVGIMIIIEYHNDDYY